MFLFCCWKALLKLGVNQFSSIFWVPNSGSRIFIKSFITTSVYRFSVNFKPCAFIQMYFFAAGKHYWNQVLISFLLFFQFLTVEAFFWRVETEFLSNTSSRLLYTDFGLISNRVLLFRRFFSATGKHYWNYVLTNFLPFFHFLTVEAVFLPSGNVFINSFITTSVYRFCVNLKPCAFLQIFFFLLFELMTEIRC